MVLCGCHDCQLIPVCKRKRHMNGPRIKTHCFKPWLFSDALGELAIHVICYCCSLLCFDNFSSELLTVPNLITAYIATSTYLMCNLTTAYCHAKDGSKLTTKIIEAFAPSVKVVEPSSSSNYADDVEVASLSSTSGSCK